MPDDQLSLAIRKEGQNARLAARLTGSKIDIKPESYQEDAVQEDLEDQDLPEEAAVEEVLPAQEAAETAPLSPEE